MEISEITKVFNNFNGYKSARHKVFITKNMAVLLHYVLKNLSFTKDGYMLLIPDKKDSEVLRQFCDYDVVDCYERLNLKEDTFGSGLCKNSKKYVFDKYLKINTYKRRNRDE